MLKGRLHPYLNIGYQLRIAGPAACQLRKRFPTRSHGAENLESRHQTIPGRTVFAENQMPTLFATEDVPIGEHAIDDVFVAHSGPDYLATRRTNCYIQPRVAHHRGHQSIFSQSSFSQHL